MTLPLLKLWIDTKETGFNHKSTEIFIALDCEMLRLPVQRVATTIELFFKLVVNMHRLYAILSNSFGKFNAIKNF